MQMRDFFKQFSLKNKLLSILLFILVIFSGFSLFLIQSIDEISEITNRIKNKNIPELTWYKQLEQEVMIKKYLVEAHLEKGIEPDLVDKYQDLETEQQASDLSELMPIPKDLEAYQNQVQTLDFIIVNKVGGLLEYENQEVAEDVIRNEYLPKLEEIHTSIQSASNEEFKIFNENANTYPVIIEKSLIVLLVITLVAFIISIILSYRISRSMTKPIESMVEKVNKIAKGNYGERLKHSNQLELQSLTESINQMSLQLQQSFQTIIGDKIKHEQVLNSLPIGIITYDNKSREYTTNSFVYNTLKITTDELKRLVIEETEELHPLLEMFISERNYHNKKILINLNKNKYVYLVSQTKLRDQEDNITGRIFYFIDVTESTLLEKRIVQSEKLALVGEMAAMSAHEIRNPLTVIHGFLTLMLESSEKDLMEKYNVNLMMKEVERLYSLVEQMLLMSKQKEPEKQLTKVKDVLDDLMPLLNSTLEAKNIHCELDIENHYIFADMKQLKQVFLNLFRNSIEAIGSNGKIEIKSMVAADQCILSFKDSGHGVPDHIKDSLFEPFSTSKSNGTGLGLNLVRRIIENHNGKICLSHSDKTGTEFKISLPIVKEAITNKGEPPPKPNN